MSSKYATTSNVHYDEKCVTTSLVRHSERESAIPDCLVYFCVPVQESVSYVKFLSLFF